MTIDGPPTRLRRMLFHIACTISLAWPALINGQPFFFPDSTAYVRAADVAVYLFSGRRISTAWTDHYRDAVGDREHPPTRAEQPLSVHRGNDLAGGNVMAGRSPYFGAILWLSYAAGRFWPFVLAQAAIAYWLIGLSLRAFGFTDRRTLAISVAVLTLTTTLPFYVSLLMPDLLTAFGLLAFLLIAIDRGAMPRKQRLSLVALIVVSAISHPIHLYIIGTMALVLAIGAWVRRSWAAHRSALGIAALALIVGAASTMATDAVVRSHFGHSPQFVPLLSARFIADGPGMAYLDTHCPAAGFAVCAYRGRTDFNAQLFLWSLRPGDSGYLLASPAERSRMMAEDRRFAWAVLKAYPIEQGGMILRNAGEQLVSFQTILLNNDCGTSGRCGIALPPAERDGLARSLGGHGLWPQRLLTILQYGVAAIALLGLAAWVAIGRKRGDPARNHDLMLCLGLVAAAMLVNALLGGAASEAQTRYQARIVWLVPFLAILAGALWRRARIVAER